MWIAIGIVALVLGLIFSNILALKYLAKNDKLKKTTPENKEPSKKEGSGYSYDDDEDDY